MQLEQLVPGVAYAVVHKNKDGSLETKAARSVVVDGVIHTSPHGYRFVQTTLNYNGSANSYDSTIVESENIMLWDEYQAVVQQQRIDRRAATLTKKAHIEVINAFMARFGTTSKVYTTERIGDGVCAVIESEALITALDAGVVARDQHRASKPAQ